MALKTARNAGPWPGLRWGAEMKLKEKIFLAIILPLAAIGFLYCMAWIFGAPEPHL